MNGARLYSSRICPATGWSVCGITHGGVRWKRCSLPTRGWISGTTWTAVAPAPIRATRRPVRSSVWSQFAVWKALPSKRSIPGSAGVEDSLKRPGAAISTRAAVSTLSGLTGQ